MPNVIASAILAFSLILFQLIVTLMYFSWQSVILFVLVIFFQGAFNAFCFSLEEERYYREVLRDFFQVFNNATFKAYKVSDFLLDKEVYDKLNSYFYSNTLVNKNKHVDAIAKAIDIIEVRPENSEININIKTYFLLNGWHAYIFIPSDFKLNTPFNKFIFYHEILHCSYFATSNHSENASLKYIYLGVLIWCPFAVFFTFQSVVVFLIILLLTFDVWGSSFNASSKNEKIFREIWADNMSMRLLDEKESQTIFDIIRSYLKNGKFLFYDQTLGYAGNAIRMSKLANLERIDNEKDTETIEELSMNFIPVSKYDIYWRLLLIVLISILAFEPNIWHIVYCLGLIITFIVLTRKVSKNAGNHYKHIQKILSKSNVGI